MWHIVDRVGISARRCSWTALGLTGRDQAARVAAPGVAPVAAPVAAPFIDKRGVERAAPRVDSPDVEEDDLVIDRRMMNHGHSFTQLLQK